MPAVVQGPNRDLPVHRVDAGRHRTQPILPRATKDGQVEWWTGARIVCLTLGEGGHERVDPLAHTRSLAERRPIINQDTHVLLAGVEGAAQSVDWLARGIVAHRGRGFGRLKIVTDRASPCTSVS